MPVPTFVDLQRFIVNKKFIAKKVAVLKQACSHALRFYESCAMEIFDKIRQVLRFLVECLSPRIAMDGMVPHNEAKCLIMIAVIDACTLRDMRNKHRTRMWNSLLDNE